MKKFPSILLCALAALVLTVHAHSQIVIVANSSVKTLEISKADLKDIFSGLTSSLRDGVHVTPVLLKGGSANDQFLAAYMGKSEEAFRANWRSLVFSGQATMPKLFDSESAVVEYLTHNAGTIAYIARSTPHEGLRVLAVK